MAIDFDKIRKNLQGQQTATKPTVNIDFDKIRQNLGLDQKGQQVKQEPAQLRTTPGGATISPTGTVTLPERLGGGQFIKSPRDKLNEPILTDRGYGSYQPQPGMERDHVIPVSLGGTSNDPNIQLLKGADFFDKTFEKNPFEQESRQQGKMVVELKAIDDYKKGKIDLPEARNRVLNWQNTPPSLMKEWANEFEKSSQDFREQTRKGAGEFFTKGLPKGGEVIKDAVVDFFTEGLSGGFRGIRAGAELASIPISLIQNQFKPGFKTDYKTIRDQQVKIAEDLINNQREFDASMKEAAEEYLDWSEKNFGDTDKSKTKEIAKTTTDLGVLYYLAFSNMFGDLDNLIGLGVIRQGGKAAKDLALFKQIGRDVKTLRGGKFSGKVQSVEIPLKKTPKGKVGEKMIIRPSNNQVIFEGYARRFGNKVDDVTEGLSKELTESTGIPTTVEKSGKDIVIRPNVQADVVKEGLDFSKIRKDLNLPKQEVAPVEQQVKDLNKQFNIKNAEELRSNIKPDDLLTGKKLEIYKNKASEFIPKDATPETPITIYRAGTGEIQAGDFVTLNRNKALDYANQRDNVELFESTAKISDLADYGGLSSDFIYKPKIQSTKEVTREPKVLKQETGKQLVTKKKGKESKVGQSIRAKTLEKELTKDFEGVAEFTPITIKNQAKRVAKIMDNNIEQAKRMALGQEPLPDNVKGAALIKSMEDWALQEGDARFLRDLSRSPLVRETSEAGQTLRLLAERERDSAAQRIYDLRKEREKAVEKKLKRRGKKPKQEKEKIKKEIDQKLKKQVVNPKDWNDFINSIKC